MSIDIKNEPSCEEWKHGGPMQDAEVLDKAAEIVGKHRLSRDEDPELHGVTTLDYLDGLAAQLRTSAVPPVTSAPDVFYRFAVEFWGECMRTEGESPDLAVTLRARFGPCVEALRDIAHGAFTDGAAEDIARAALDALRHGAETSP